MPLLFERIRNNLLLLVSRISPRRTHALGLPVCFRDFPRFSGWYLIFTFDLLPCCAALATALFLAMTPFQLSSAKMPKPRCSIQIWPEPR